MKKRYTLLESVSKPKLFKSFTNPKYRSRIKIASALCCHAFNSVDAVTSADYSGLMTHWTLY